MSDSDLSAHPAKDPETVQRIPVFVSYSWRVEAATRIVEKLEQACEERKSLRLIRDNRHLKYGDSIIDFMDSLGAGRHVVAVVSPEFLESEFCMYEMLKLSQEGELKERLYPLVVKGLSLSTANDRLDWVEHWEKATTAFDERLKRSSGHHRPGQNRDLDRMMEIRSSISELLDYLAYHKNLDLKAGIDHDFSELLVRIEKDAESSPPAGRETSPKKAEQQATGKAPDGPPTAFDDQIKEHIAKELEQRECTPLVQAMRDRLKLPNHASVADIATSLAGHVEIAEELDLIHEAVHETLPGLRGGDGGRRGPCVELAKVLFGWLVLRAVDDGWVRNNRHLLGDKLEVSISDEAVIEVLISRVDGKPGDWGEIRGSRLPGSCGMHLDDSVESGYSGPVQFQNVACAVWKQVFDGESRTSLSDHEVERRNARLRERGRWGKRQYLTVPVGDRGGPKANPGLYDELKSRLWNLRVIFVGVEGHGDMLVMKEVDLGQKIYAFVETLKEYS